MKNVASILGFVLVVVLLVGCAVVRTKPISEDQYRSLVSQTCFSVPDSQMTYEQLSMKIKVMDYLYSNMVIKDNKQCLSGTRRQMTAAGIPAVYFDVLCYQINETNTFVERELKNGHLPAGSIDVEKIYAEAKNRYCETERPEMQARLEKLR